MGELMASFEWENGPLGAVSTWPQSLRSILSVVLTSAQPIFVWWGPDLIQFYNDAYRPILGKTMHPAALGAAGRVTWAGIWDIISPMIEAVMVRGESTEVRDGLLVLDRNGFPEEAYFDYAYSPIRDESGEVGGIFAACGETTDRVIGERRLRLIRDLGVDVGRTVSPADAHEQAVKTLASAELDVAFAALYSFNDNGTASLAASSGLPPALLQPALWPIEAARGSSEPILTLLPDGIVVTGLAWPEPVRHAAAVGLSAQGEGGSIGVLVLGISPRRFFDPEYARFVSIIADQVGAAISSARSQENDRMRATTLAELATAKDDFFSNVSHEFRTPLTLLLGPLEDAIVRLPPGPIRDGVELAHRNGLRLLRLTNELLDFSRSAAGKVEAQLVPLDLGRLTDDVASSFHAVFKDGAVELRVECPAMQRTTEIDPDLWETIVLNLVSNAYKYTLHGSVTVSTALLGDQVELCISDTGVGISVTDIDRVFDRFHRVQGVRSRSHEGTGIGLSLVRELVAVLGGTIRVESKLGVGSTFRVTLPSSGRLTGPSKHAGIASVNEEAQARTRASFIAEAQHWRNDGVATLGYDIDENSQPPIGGFKPGRKPIALVIDDSSDMRSHITSILGERYEVQTAPDGAVALQKIAGSLPDIIVTDIMMPNMDGIELIQRLRADSATAQIPIIVLSARAGYDARIDGHDAGADDYLAKPFSTPELLARCRTTLELATLRKAALHDAHALFDREHEIAVELQRALLPDRIPSHRSVDISVLYRPASPGLQVGGDWYDVLLIDDDHLLLAVGDAAGHDIRSATTMARLHNSLRAYAIENSGPASILARLDTLVQRIVTDFTTVFVGLLDLNSGRLSYANAGHPPAVVRDEVTTSVLAGGHGPPLGLTDKPRVQDEVDLRSGEVLVLYSDGLIERRGEPITDGLARLQNVLSESSVTDTDPGAEFGEFSRNIADRLVPGTAEDDVVVVAVRWNPPKVSVHPY